MTSCAVAADGTPSTRNVAGYGQGEVLRLPEATVVAKVANPANLAFRGGALLVVDYRLGEPMLEGALPALELGACGAP